MKQINVLHALDKDAILLDLIADTWNVWSWINRFLATRKQRSSDREKESKNKTFPKLKPV